MASLQELEQAFIAADNAGNTDDAQAFATEIKRQRAAQPVSTPSTAFDMSPAAMNAYYAASTQAANDAANGPSAAGAFFREAGRSVGPGAAGFAGGMGAGALAGMVGGPFAPITVPVAALVGGLTTGMATRKLQDVTVDAIAPNSFAGTASATQDYQTQPLSTLLGGALATGRPAPFRAAGAIKTLATQEGRGLLSQAIQKGAPPVARAALDDVVDVAAGAGIGAGMSLATGDGMALENAGVGLLFNRGYFGGRQSLSTDVQPARAAEVAVDVPTGPVMNGPIIEANPSQPVTPPPALFTEATIPKVDSPAAEPTIAPAAEAAAVETAPKMAQQLEVELEDLKAQRAAKIKEAKAGSGTDAGKVAMEEAAMLNAASVEKQNELFSAQRVEKSADPLPEPEVAVAAPEAEVIPENIPVEPAPEVVAPVAQNPQFTLPQELSKASPNYGYKDRNFKIQFESDLDKAAYTLAGDAAKGKESKAAPKFKKALADAGLDEAAVIEHGKKVREQLKEQARTTAGGEDLISIPDQGFEKPPSAATPDAENVRPKSVTPASPEVTPKITKPGDVVRIDGEGQVLTVESVGEDGWVYFKNGQGGIDPDQALKLKPAKLGDDRVNDPVGSFGYGPKPRTELEMLEASSMGDTPRAKELRSRLSNEETTYKEPVPPATENRVSMESPDPSQSEQAAVSNKTQKQRTAEIVELNKRIKSEEDPAARGQLTEQRDAIKAEKEAITAIGKTPKEEPQRTPAAEEPPAVKTKSLEERINAIPEVEPKLSENATEFEKNLHAAMWARERGVAKGAPLDPRKVAEIRRQSEAAPAAEVKTTPKPSTEESLPKKQTIAEIQEEYRKAKMDLEASQKAASEARTTLAEGEEVSVPISGNSGESHTVHLKGKQLEDWKVAENVYKSDLKANEDYLARTGDKEMKVREDIRSANEMNRRKREIAGKSTPDEVKEATLNKNRDKIPPEESLLQIAKNQVESQVAETTGEPVVQKAGDAWANPKLKRSQQKRKNSSATTNIALFGMDAKSARLVYEAALHAARITINAGESVANAVKSGLAAISNYKLTKQQEKQLRAALSAELHTQARLARGDEAHFKGEIGRVLGNFIADGVEPSAKNIAQQLAQEWPDKAQFYRQHTKRLLEDILVDKQQISSHDSEKMRAWKAWGNGVADNVKEVIRGAKDGDGFQSAKRTASAMHDKVFTSMGVAAHDLANGKLTGKASYAFKEWVNDHLGLKMGEDGVNRLSSDDKQHTDQTRFLNKLGEFSNEVRKDPAFSKLSPSEQKGMLKTMVEHLLDPELDHLLDKSPLMKRSVEVFSGMRGEVLAYMKEHDIPIGDLTDRSMGRQYDHAVINSNEKSFLADAEAAYKVKWGREANEMRARLENVAAGSPEAKRLNKEIKNRMDLIQSGEAAVRAQKFLYGLQSGERGITSDGGDFFSPEGGIAPSIFKTREFGVEGDQILGKYMHQDPFEQIAAEVRSATRAVTKARMLSSVDDEGNFDQLGKWKALRKAMEAEGNGDMYPLALQLTKDYLDLGGASNPTARAIIQNIHGVTQLTYLSHASVAAIGDPTLLALRAGSAKSALTGYKEMGTSVYRALRGLSDTEDMIIAKYFGEAKEGLYAIAGERSINDAYSGRGFLGKATTAFHQKTLLHDLTNGLAAAAIKVARSFIHCQLELAAGEGKTSRLALRALNEVGIARQDIPEMLKFCNELAKSKNKLDMIFGDHPMAKKYGEALQLFKRTGGALDPTRGTKTAASNNPLASLWYSLTSFLYEFHNKVVARQLSRGKSAITGRMMIEGKEELLTGAERGQIFKEIAAGAAGIYATQYGLQVAREYLLSDPERIKRDKRRTPEEIRSLRAKAAFSRTGILGPYDTIYNMILQARYRREPATVMLGPAIGGASEIFQQLATLLNKDLNSDNSNTAERKGARVAYSTIAAPLMSTFASTMPGYLVPGVFTQAANHPWSRERVTDLIAGDPVLPKSLRDSKGPLRTGM